MKIEITDTDCIFWLDEAISPTPTGYQVSLNQSDSETLTRLGTADIQIILQETAPTDKNWSVAKEHFKFKLSHTSSYPYKNV